MEAVRDIVERLTPKMRGIARQLSRDYADDLYSEMALAIVVAGSGHTDSFYLEDAKHRAIDYLRKQRREESRERRAAAAVAGGGRVGIGDAYDAYDQDKDFLDANWGWD